MKNMRGDKLSHLINYFCWHSSKIYRLAIYLWKQLAPSAESIWNLNRLLVIFVYLSKNLGKVGAPLENTYRQVDAAIKRQKGQAQ